jgi:hypothetical protein
VPGALEKLAVLVPPDFLASLLDYAAHIIIPAWGRLTGSRPEPRKTMVWK